MANEEMEEWDLFKRLDAIEPTLKDAWGMAAVAFLLVFYNTAEDTPNPRGLKDGLVKSFNLVGMSPEMQKSLEKAMLSACEEIEKKREQDR